jgi:hypothetical protein
MSTIRPQACGGAIVGHFGRIVETRAMVGAKPAPAMPLIEVVARRQRVTTTLR